MAQPIRWADAGQSSRIALGPGGADLVGTSVVPVGRRAEFVPESGGHSLSLTVQADARPAGAD